MPEYRIIDNRRSESRLVTQMASKSTVFRNLLLERISEEIVKASPVDTGTYMDGHNIHDGRQNVARTESSSKKERNQARGPFEQQALARMKSQIEALPTDAVAHVSNNAVHSPAVEYGGHNWNRGPYAVYRRARAKIQSLVQGVALEVYSRGGR